ncbi:lysyl-tRNA synthetase [candidate division WOR_3 bacterium SM23_42]|uniref:Lysine--tRNA ligase n=1 Tax=candidate division WOR_3 bacterium SM23_42 TaxID=1703779 RepID=A0A0S8FVN7_UNCW3|nr:MAG: lysyl-tRNA synthetase [candidate division WOR_3 bacterium SM23_42]
MYHSNMEERLKKLEKLKEIGVDPYPHSFHRTHTFRQVKENFETLSKSEETVSTCGRLMTVRGHGKTVFATLSDESGKMQVYLRKDRLGEKFEQFQYYDVGDFVGVKGAIFRTKTEEITVLVDDYVLLSKSLRPLPEKWHGLRDVEIRYRKRYLDLIANAEVRTIFRRRTRLISLMRRFLDEGGFIEVETPVLQPIYGGAAANPFKTYYNALEQDMFLRIADELYLKRLIVGGYERVYEVCRDFRNEGIDRMHNPEFTMLELYQAYADYTDIMELVELMIEYLLAETGNRKNIRFLDSVIDFSLPFRRIKYVESLTEELGLDVLAAKEDELDEQCERRGIDYKKLSVGSKIDRLFGETVQKKLVEPTFVVDYPKIISPLAKTHRDDDLLVERFELFIFGVEIANAFSELNDPVEQRERFEAQLAHREQGIGQIDEDFIQALEHGMPPTGGIGVGIDRLCMVLLNQPSIRDVILFPQLRRES